jgi:hypothetical protein
MICDLLGFIFAIFNGFIVKYPAMRAYWRWLNRLVPSTWMLYGVASSQLGGQQALVVMSDGSTKSAQQYLSETFGFDYDFRFVMELPLPLALAPLLHSSCTADLCRPPPAPVSEACLRPAWSPAQMELPADRGRLLCVLPHRLHAGAALLQLPAEVARHLLSGRRRQEPGKGGPDAALRHHIRQLPNAGSQARPMVARQLLEATTSTATNILVAVCALNLELCL